MKGSGRLYARRSGQCEGTERRKGERGDQLSDGVFKYLLVDPPMHRLGMTARQVAWTQVLGAARGSRASLGLQGRAHTRLAQLLLCLPAHCSTYRGQRVCGALFAEVFKGALRVWRMERCSAAPG